MQLCQTYLLLTFIKLSVFTGSIKGQKKSGTSTSVSAIEKDKETGTGLIYIYRDHTVIHHPTQFHTLQMFPLLLRTCTDTECKKHNVTFCDLRLEFLILSTVHIHALPKSGCQREPTALSTRRASKNPFRQRIRGIRIKRSPTCKPELFVDHWTSILEKGTDE